MNVVGHWSTLMFSPHEPANEVLALLPDGSGVYEYYWWRLSFYATFTYSLDGDLLTVRGVKDYDFDFDTKTQTETDSAWVFSTRVSLAAGRDHAGEEVEILQLAEALPLTKEVRFGRTTAAQDMQYYSLPSFWEEEA